MKKIVIAALLSTFALALQAQTTLFGTVSTTKGERVIGANVVVEGTYDGASTDTLGRFSFKTMEKDAQRLVITFIGCDTLKMAVVLRDPNFELNAKLKESLNELNEITITAGSFEASDEKKTTVLKPLDIVLTAGASADVVGALTTLPGTTRNPESGQLFVRGGGAYETRTFIDGLRVQSPYNSSVPNVPARGRFSPFLFKGTMFSTGGYSAEYGQALSSALVLNTSDVEGSTVTGISVSSVFVGASQTKKWDKAVLSATGTYSNLQPYFGLIAQRFDWVSAPQSGGGEVNFKVKTSETGIFKLYSSTSFSSFKMNYPVDGDATQKSPLLLRGSNVYTNASYRDLLRGNWSFFVGAAHSYNKDDIQQNFNLTTKEQSAQGRFTLGKRLSDVVKVKFGAEYLNNVYNENYVTPTNQTFTTRHDDNFVSAFGETDVTVSEKFVAKIGVRAEHSSLINRSNIAPRLAAAYILGKNEQISAAFGQFYQTPEHTLMRRTTDVNFERADHYMLTYQKLWSGYTLRSEIYYKNYQSLVKTTPSVNSAFSAANNDGKGYAQGVDVFFRDSKSIKNGDYWISYSYLDTKRDYRDFPTAAAPTFASTHNASVVYKHWLSKWHTSAGATYAYSSGRPFNDPNTTVFNGGKTPAYHDLSLTASYVTNIKGNMTILHFMLNNLLGNEQVFGYQYGKTPNATGKMEGKAITTGAKRFFFVGCFISIGQKFEKQKGNNDDI
jgi:vitamin B12 transporter